MEHLKPKDFWKIYSTQIEDDDFRRYYRLDRGTFQALKTFLNPSVHIYQGGREQVSPHKMLGMTLFFLGSRLPYIQLAGIFRVSSECFIHSSDYIIELLNKKCAEVIKWPRKDKYKEIANKFNEAPRRKFSYVIGALDGRHIHFSPNKCEIHSYRNFKQFHSIHLQAVCLSNRKFTDIFVG